MIDNTGTSGTIYNDFTGLFVFPVTFNALMIPASNLQWQFRADRRGNRNVEKLFQTFLNFKASWSTDVF